jgi:phage gpG-like protein
MNIKFEILGKKQVSTILSNIYSRVKDLRPAFKQIADNFRETERITFEKQGRPGEWRALSPKYAAWKAKNYPGKPIMVLTGDLKKSLTSRGGNHYEKIGRQELEIGTKDKLGIFHQKGAGRLPVRKLISPTPRDISEWVQITRSFIIEKLGLRKV